MGHHSNHKIKKHVESSSDLIKKMDALTNQLRKTLESEFQSNLGVPLPNAIEADVRVLQYDMVYSTDPIFKEYEEGAQSVLEGALAENWPQVALASLDVVTNVLNGVIGSGSVQTGTSVDSVKKTEDDEENPLNKKTFVSASIAVVEEANAKDWKTKENFYVSYYALVVWPVKEDELSLITTNR